MNYLKRECVQMRFFSIKGNQTKTPVGHKDRLVEVGQHCCRSGLVRSGRGRALGAGPVLRAVCARIRAALPHARREGAPHGKQAAAEVGTVGTDTGSGEKEFLRWR